MLTLTLAGNIDQSQLRSVNIDQSLISVIRYKPIIFQDLEKRRKKICEKMGKKYVPLKRTYKKRASKPKKKKSDDTSGNTPF